MYSLNLANQTWVIAIGSLGYQVVRNLANLPERVPCEILLIDQEDHQEEFASASGISTLTAPLCLNSMDHNLLRRKARNHSQVVIFTGLGSNFENVVAAELSSSMIRAKNLTMVLAALPPADKCTPAAKGAVSVIEAVVDAFVLLDCGELCSHLAPGDEPGQALVPLLARRLTIALEMMVDDRLDSRFRPALMGTGAVCFHTFTSHAADQETRFQEVEEALEAAVKLHPELAEKKNSYWRVRVTHETFDFPDPELESFLERTEEILGENEPFWLSQAISFNPCLLEFSVLLW